MRYCLLPFVLACEFSMDFGKITDSDSSNPVDEDTTPSDSNNPEDADDLWGWDESENSTDPTDPTWPDEPYWTDTDGDGLSDEDEWYLGTDPENPDTDGDGLSDGEEIHYGLDPLNPDTDGDGLLDGDDLPTNGSDDLWGWDNSGGNSQGGDFSGTYNMHLDLFDAQSQYPICSDAWILTVEDDASFWTGGDCVDAAGLNHAMTIEGVFEDASYYPGSPTGIPSAGYYLYGDGLLNQSVSFTVDGECYNNGNGDSIFLYWEIAGYDAAGNFIHHFGMLSSY